MRCFVKNDGGVLKYCCLHSIPPMIPMYSVAWTVLEPPLGTLLWSVIELGSYSSLIDLEYSNPPHIPPPLSLALFPALFAIKKLGKYDPSPSPKIQDYQYFRLQWHVALTIATRGPTPNLLLYIPPIPCLRTETLFAI